MIHPIHSLAPAAPPGARPVPPPAAVSLRDLAAFHEGWATPSARDPEFAGAVGERLLTSFEQVNTSHSSSLENLQSTLNKIGSTSSPHPQDLLMAQVQFGALALEEHLVAKVCDKSSEGVKTLFKNQ